MEGQGEDGLGCTEHQGQFREWQKQARAEAVLTPICWDLGSSTGLQGSHGIRNTWIPHPGLASKESSSGYLSNKSHSSLTHPPTQSQCGTALKKSVNNFVKGFRKKTTELQATDTPVKINNSKKRRTVT